MIQKKIEMKVSSFPGEKKNDNFQLMCLYQKQFHLPDDFTGWCQDNAKESVFLAECHPQC